MSSSSTPNATSAGCERSADYEAACAALKRRRDRKEIADAAFLAGTRQLYNAYQKDLDAEFYAENTWENGRLAL